MGAVCNLEGVCNRDRPGGAENTSTYNLNSLFSFVKCVNSTKNSSYQILKIDVIYNEMI